MPTIYTEVEVDVELSDFDTEDLIEDWQVVIVVIICLAMI